ncbi:MAG: bifunctional DNA primase/polymerase [Terricaulis sp.]
MKTGKPATGQTVADFGNAALACNAARPEDSPNLTDFQRQSVLACGVSHAALELAGLGFACVPLSADRKPMLRGWPDFTADPAATGARFAHCRAAGLALVMRAPLFVLDLDRGHGNGVDGVANFAALVHAHGGDFPKGPRVRTRRGGVHVWLRAPDGVAIRSSAGRIAPGVDIKGFRSSAVCPPTAGYTWIGHARDIAPPMAPAWLLDMVAPIEAPRVAAASVRPYRGEASAYARVALERELKAVASAAPGVRNAALFKAAASLGSLCAGGALPADPVAASLLEAAAACGLVGNDGLHAVEATTASGFKAGLARPRALPSQYGRRA